ncbi:hypothetical protein PsYK624_151670 [Phanerochaete sordida]|uniref:Uncharacterized protein n=1 Tax=Phanerochaete sordida TaxID=48140 RepID=A0A9P3GNU9_9APHY|nr:hypothetical protein PsYK624_151670 [Phanerochaete sordida]
MKTSVYEVFGVGAPFDPTFSLVTSPVLPPLALAALRLLLALYGTVFVLFRLIYEGVRDHTDAAFFSYFTDLSYIGLLAYFWAAGAQTLSYARAQRTHPLAPSYALQRWPRALQAAHLLLQSSALAFPLLVTAVFWGVLAGPDTLATRYAAWVNVSEHALNSGFVALEVVLSGAAPALPRRARSGVAMPWAHLPLLLVLLAGYLGVASITSATQGFYPYAFLDPHTQGGTLAAYIVGIAAGACAAFVLVRYAMLGRHLLALYFTRNSQQNESSFFGASTSVLDFASVAGGGGGGAGGGGGGGGERKGSKGDVEALEDWEEVGRPSMGSGERGVAL